MNQRTNGQWIHSTNTVTVLIKKKHQNHRSSLGFFHERSCVKAVISGQKKTIKKESPVLTNTREEYSSTLVLWTAPLLDSRRRRRCDEFPWSQRGKRSWTCSHICCCWGEITSSTHFDGERNTHTHWLSAELLGSNSFFIFFSQVPLLFLSIFFPTLNLSSAFLEMTLTLLGYWLFCLSFTFLPH